jgi:hypothetical protein
MKHLGHTFKDRASSKTLQSKFQMSEQSMPSHLGYDKETVEEMGRIKPRTVSELMDIANRFADGKDAYNNKRT